MDVYTLGDVARICRVSAARLRYWERTALVELSARIDSQPAFDFEDLVSVRSVVGLLSRGVPLHRIRRSVQAVRERIPELDRPLGALRVWTEGSRRVVVRHDGVLVEPDGQTVLDFGDGAEAVALDVHRGRNADDTVYDHALWWFERGCALDADPATLRDAIHAYERAVELDPAFADAHCNLGSIHFNRGVRAAARACFERALAIAPSHVEANLNLAAILEETGHDEAALRHYKTALAADPLRHDTHVSLALLYEKLGLRRIARGYWRRYLQLDPAGAWAEIARHRTGITPH